IGMEPGAGDDMTRDEIAARRLEDHLVPALLDPGDRSGEVDRRTTAAELIGHCVGDGAVVDDARARAPQRPDAGRVWLELLDPLRADLLDRDLVRGGTLLQRSESRQLLLGERDDQLSAVLERNPVLGRECLDRHLALAA